MMRPSTGCTAINSSIGGIESLTSLSVVIYCDNNFVHAGEYLSYHVLACTSFEVGKGKATRLTLPQ
ncbi:hypothetical protein PISMIDRAFT_638318 [Pisolithus microcarpus 441]|uniref:Uncharacterized protein n=1 Tax=Pisolithus microcarpus 441 TaxID=765257 RepID=A0A0C9YGJ5_9AGAM|nr:hypothetical protein PISMIDRAFT_638318 [Pisolithus microcarpus 441]